MKTSVEVRSVFNCPIERAFKAPILGDATKFLNGYMLQPPVTGFEDDASWGQKGSVRYPVTSGNLLVKEGRLFTDKVLERVENNYWKWTIYDFQIKSLFFTNKAIGEWYVDEKEDKTIAV